MIVVVAISGKDAMRLIQQKRICNCSCIDIYEEHTIDIIKDVLQSSTGYDSSPVVGISKIDGEEVNVHKHLEDIIEYLSITSGEVILVCDIPDDEVICIENDELMEYENNLESNMDDLDFIDEDIKEKFSLSSQSSNRNEICFFNCLRLKDCRSYAILSNEWKVIKKSLGNLPEIKLERSHVF